MFFSWFMKRHSLHWHWGNHAIEHVSLYQTFNVRNTPISHPQGWAVWCNAYCIFHQDSHYIADSTHASLRWLIHICVSKSTIIVPDNGLSPGRRQAIIWTNAEIWLVRTLGTNFSEILSEIHIFSFKNMHLKMSSAKWQPFYLGLNVLSNSQPI